MTEYTRKDIIMDPNDPRLEGAIGKKVYSSSDINLVLNRANNDEYEMTLTQVEDVGSEPFTVTDMDGDEIDADFIIIKKEPELEYVPFESADEFIDAYDYANHSVENGSIENKLINYGGIWLKDKERTHGLWLPKYGMKEWSLEIARLRLLRMGMMSISQ